MNEDTKQPTVRDEISGLIVSVQPNIKYKDLIRLVNTFEVGLKGLRDLQVIEDKEK